MAMHPTIIKTDSESHEIQEYLDDFFKGRISYVRLCNELDMETSEVDAYIVEAICKSVRKNSDEGVFGH